MRTSAVDWLSGSCMLIRKEAWEQVRGFDETFFLYFEDIDFCRRLKKAGWSIRLSSEVSIEHAGGASADQYPIQANQHYRQSLFYYVRKHYGPTWEKVVRVLVFARSGARKNYQGLRLALVRRRP